MNTFNRDNNRAVWFDIPVVDMDRAVAFYAHVLGITIDVETFEDTKFAVLEHQEGNGGCLVVAPEQVSGKAGILVYLNVHGRIRDAVDKARQHGGSIVEDVHGIGPHGYRALLLDSEGNRIALHSEDDA